MKTILLLNASPMGTASRAYTLAKKAASNLLSAYSDTALVERDLSRLHASPIRAAYADAIIGQAEHDAPDFAASEMLIREVEICDYLIVATPMHNFSVPASLKLWIDYVLRGGRSFTYRDGYKVGLLADRPTLIVVGSVGSITVRRPASPTISLPISPMFWRRSALRMCASSACRVW